MLDLFNGNADHSHLLTRLGKHARDTRRNLTALLDGAPGVLKQNDRLLDSLHRPSHQVAHLTHHHGKAPTCRTDPRGLNHRVQGEDTCLERDISDHPGNTWNLLRRLADLIHRAGQLLHPPIALQDLHDGLRYIFRDLPHILYADFRLLIDDRDRGRQLLCGGRLLGGAHGQGPHRCRHPLGPSIDLLQRDISERKRLI